MPRAALRRASLNYYATVTSNNRIKVYSLDSYKLLTEMYEANYLQLDYTCMCLFDDNDKQILIAVGDKVGRIVIFDVLKSRKIIEISHHSKDESLNCDFVHVCSGHQSQVNFITFDESLNCLSLVSSGKDNKIYRWNVTNGRLLATYNNNGEYDASCIALSSSLKSYMMVAVNRIQVWSVADPIQCIGSFEGHAQRIRQMQMTPDDQYLLSFGHDRFIYIWKCKPFYKNQNKKKSQMNSLQSVGAQYCLAMNDDIIAMDVQMETRTTTSKDKLYLGQLLNKHQKHQKHQKHKCKKNKISDTKNVYYIIGASRSAIHIWYFDPICEHKKQEKDNNILKPVTVIRTKHDAIQHVQLGNAKKLIVVCGTISYPRFQQIEYVYSNNNNNNSNNDNNNDDDDDTPHFIGDLTLDNVQLKTDKNVFESQHNIVVDTHVTVLDVADSAIANPKSYETTCLKRKRTDLNVDVEPDDDAEPASKKARTFQHQLLAIEQEFEKVQNNSKLKTIPNADSLYRLLTQSLSSNDQTMFERLMSMQNDETIREFEDDLIKNTLQRISSGMAIQLLAKLSDKFRVSPRQSIVILQWLLPLLNSHSASFAKDLSSRKHLISVHQAIDYQIKSLFPAIKLQGRLSLLMNQMNKVKVSQHTPNMNDLTCRPLFVHDELKQDNLSFTDL